MASCSLIKKFNTNLTLDGKQPPLVYPPSVVENNPRLEKRNKVILNDGGTYEGQWIYGTNIREGYGREIMRDGSLYVGQYKESYKTGQGKLTLKEGYEYEGGFLNDAYHGLGKMKYPDGRFY